MSEVSPVLSLPYIAPAQAQKHVTHNEALRVLDALVQPTVASRTAGDPPASPLHGDRYVVGPSASGLWAAHAGDLALFEEGLGWSFFAAKHGWVVHVRDEDILCAFDGSDWQPLGLYANQPLQNVPQLGIATGADETNRLAVASDATLLSHAGNGHQLKINKAMAADTASLLFQTTWGGRAEMGTTGSDDFAVKVSADGSSWTDVMVMAADGSATQFGTPVIVDEDVAADRLISSTHKHSYLTMTLNNSHADPVASSIQMGFGGVRRYACLVHAGFEQFNITAYDAAGVWKGSPVVLEFPGSASMNNALYIDKNSHVGIGKAPGAAKLDIDGIARLKPLSKSALPAASTVGPGGIAFVSNAAGGAQPAYSDGTNWRKMSDNQVV
ncbi:DUF2793 domain-containing protein [Primorskyibacter flagellatus]|uniref:DUF2793 domain-containing protein n=1 Tax=Primorskyibacter flagellatus TaxID=1387277 RepID=A0A1W1ZZ20_9RHOB|nr:DUF2793 domain-containing protein [Primorskyibacter flagellatus]SMC53633.1 Protein of unknown function [Primorskyibacter flagellatus]